MMRLLEGANARRTTEATKANETSSRSHAILQLNIYKKPRAAGYEFEQKTGRMSMIDLAGSERGSVTENRGIRLFEGAKINRSLLALANCINALGDKNRKGTFVPYRDSKLTRLLKDSLGGKSKTLMLCAIAPGSAMFEETLNTLKYANRAKEIKVEVEENKKVVELHIAEYKGIIEDLRKEIDDLNRIGRNNNVQALANPDIKTCPYCELKPEVNKMIETFKELLDERIQLRKQVCEIKAQNMQNKLEMKKVEGGSSPSSKPGGAKYEEMNNLEKSTFFNQDLEAETEARMKEISEEAADLLSEIQSQLRSKDSKLVLEQIVQLKATQIENLELELNLKYYEKLNKILMEEYKDLERQVLNAGLADADTDQPQRLAPVEEDEEDEDIDINQTNEDIKRLKESLRESGIQFDEISPEDEERREEEEKELESRYQGMEGSILKPSEVLSEDERSFEDDMVAAKPKNVGQSNRPSGRPDRDDQFDAVSIDSDDNNNHLSPGDRGNQRISASYKSDQKPSIQPESRRMTEFGDTPGGPSQRQSEVSLQNSPEGKGPVSKADMKKEMELLNTIDKSRLNFDHLPSAPIHERLSTIRGDRRKDPIQWNMLVLWGNEFKTYEGEFYPETSASFEGEIDISDKDFEQLLSKDELALLRKIELGDSDEF
jgi:hypothetical protein